MQKNRVLHSVQLMSRNLDFSLRVKKAKSVLVISDKLKEGKSKFIGECAPVLSDLYKRKILIFDFQQERHSTLEKDLRPLKRKEGAIFRSHHPGVDYVHVEDLHFLKTLEKDERAGALKKYYRDTAQTYDVVFINTKNTVPELPIDGAVLVTSGRSLGRKKRPLTEEVCDREIPILGVVMNGGI